MRTVRQSVGRVFLVPGWIALATFVGLIAGLLGEGGLDALAWLGLGVPLAAIGLALARRGG